MYQSVTAFYWSPTGTTERIARRLAAALGEAAAVDLSVRGLPLQACPADGLAVFAVPVFSGRVPAPAAGAVRRCRGDGTPAAAVAVYGNRAFDDALLELGDLLSEQGFIPVAGGAFIAEHSMLRSVAAGRPDGDDLAQLDAFAAAIRKKLADSGAMAAALPGNRPYRDPGSLPFRPAASAACTKCGLCAACCPVGAIPADAPGQTGKECILCMRCAAICPAGARALPLAARAGVRLKLGKLEGVRLENQTWL